MPGPQETILLAGATGFVGSRLWPALRQLGHPVRCLTRNVEAARQRWPERDWVVGDVASEPALREALGGCTAAYYLVHGMAGSRGDFRQQETAAARRFSDAAAAAGLRRIIYLGGVAPRVRASEHLASRLEVGELLRSGAVPALELRASMIIGHGSLSWQIVRDLAARLPGMILPRWLRSRTQPVGIEDVLRALTAALTVPLEGSAWHDIPGPDVLSGAEILKETARLLGLRPPLMLEVPFLTPWLSSLWLRLVTRADWSVARELVAGLTEDLLAVDDRFWQTAGLPPPEGFAEAARRAILEERGGSLISGFWGAEEQLVARLRRAPSAPGRGPA
jgi:uncharacterized protein YbjT (DUF2867 family)